MDKAAGGLTPELSVGNIEASLRFYREVLGFSCLYARPDEGFAMLEREGARIMLDQIGVGRDFDPGLSTLPRPWGRGINLQIETQDLRPLLAALAANAVPLVLPPEERWYRAGSQDLGNRQFVVADPDGYLLRFFEDMGARRAKD